VFGPVRPCKPRDLGEMTHEVAIRGTTPWEPGFQSLRMSLRTSIHERRRPWSDRPDYRRYGLDAVLALGPPRGGPGGSLMAVMPLAVMPLIHGGRSDVRCLHPAKDSRATAGSFLELEGERTMLARSKQPRRNVGSPIHSCIPLKSMSVLERMTSKIESHPK
jgi:hypothetical protein